MHTYVIAGDYYEVLTFVVVFFMVDSAVTKYHVAGNFQGVRFSLIGNFFYFFPSLIFVDACNYAHYASCNHAHFVG